MLQILPRNCIIWNLFPYILALVSHQLSNAQDLGEYLDVGEATGDFKIALPKGFHPGGSIVVNGTVNPHTNKFIINLQNDEGSKFFLHIGVRFYEKRIVFNHNLDADGHRRESSWGNEVFSNLTGLRQGAEFEITILCNATGYMININNKPCKFFAHRFDTSRIRNIWIKGLNSYEEVILGRAAAKASSTHDSSWQAWQAFESGRTQGWGSRDGDGLPQSLWYEFPEPIRFQKFSFQGRRDNSEWNRKQGPTEYSFWGSNGNDCEDSTERVTLFEDRSGTEFSSVDETREGSFEINETYKCYGFQVFSTPYKRNCAISNVRFFTKGEAGIKSIRYISGNQTCQIEGCNGNDREECVLADNQFQCQCVDGYTGPLCQDTCKVNGCTGNNVCVFSNDKYLCRNRMDLAAEGGSSSNTTIQCPHPYVAVDSECVWVVMSRLNWDAARLGCEVSGGFLMEPDFPINFKLYIGNNYPENSMGVFWLGSTDRGLQRWVWVTSLIDVQDDFPWGEGEPNDGSWNNKEDCMNLYSSSRRSYFYNDSPCNNDYFYICEAHPIVSNPRTVAADQVEDKSSPAQQGSQILVAILLLLIISIICHAAVFIYTNFNPTKKGNSSLGFSSVTFGKKYSWKPNDDFDDNLVESDTGLNLNIQNVN